MSDLPVSMWRLRYLRFHFYRVLFSESHGSKESHLVGVIGFRRYIQALHMQVQPKKGLTV